MKKQLLILLISILFCSCNTYKIALTSDADNRFILHETNRPDTCKANRLTYVSFRKKVAPTTNLYKHFSSFDSFQKELKNHVVFNIAKNGDTINIGGDLYIIKYDY